MEEKLQKLDVVSEGVACITEHEGFTADLEGEWPSQLHNELLVMPRPLSLTALQLPWGRGLGLLYSSGSAS